MFGNLPAGKYVGMANPSVTASCPSCTAELPAGSRFCARCGTSLGAGETIELIPHSVDPDSELTSAPASTQPPTAVHQVHRRPLGAHPVPLLGAFGSLALVLAIVVLASGSAVAGLVLLVLALALFALFAGGVRREPDAPTAGPALRAVVRLRSLARLASISGGAWFRAGVELARIRHRQRQLRSRLKGNLAPLGEAVHHDDEERVRALKRKTAELEHELIDSDRQASGVIADARETIRRR